MGLTGPGMRLKGAKSTALEINRGAAVGEV